MFAESSQRLWQKHSAKPFSLVGEAMVIRAGHTQWKVGLVEAASGYPTSRGQWSFAPMFKRTIFRARFVKTTLEHRSDTFEGRHLREYRGTGWEWL